MIKDVSLTRWQISDGLISWNSADENLCCNATFILQLYKCFICWMPETSAQWSYQNLGLKVQFSMCWVVNSAVFLWKNALVGKKRASDTVPPRLCLFNSRSIAIFTSINSNTHLFMLWNITVFSSFKMLWITKLFSKNRNLLFNMLMKYNQKPDL